MKRSRARNATFILLIALALALVIYPTVTTSAQEGGVKSAWERVREVGSYRFLSAVDQTLVPRPIPEMIGEQEQRLSLTIKGAVQLPDRAYLEMWAESGATQVPPVALIRDGDQTFMQQDGQITPVEDPIGAVVPTGDWLGYLVAAENVQLIDSAPGEGGELVGFRFEIDGPRLAEYVREQAEAALRQDPGAPPELSVAPSPLLRRLTGQGELWVGTDGLPRRQTLDLHMPRVSEAYDAQVHMVVELHDFGQVEALPRVVPAEDGGWQLETVEPMSPSSSRGLPVLSRVRFAIHVAPSDLVFFWLCLIVVAVAVSYRRRPRQTYALIAAATAIILVIIPLFKSVQVAHFFERQVQTAEARAAAAPELAAALGFETDKGQLAGVTSADQTSASDRTDDIAQTLASAPPLLATTADSAPMARRQATEDAVIEACGQGFPDADADEDGLNDQLEGCLGTDPYAADSDHDSLPDALELGGLVLTDDKGITRTWTTDPLNVDSNRDGIIDLLEWPAPEGLARGPDLDGDGVPNVWDDDNDGDGVPDGIDLSPMAVTDDYAKTFDLIIEQQRSFDGYQYVEFQVQPQEPAHLRYSTTALNWPHDEQGNVQDWNGSIDDIRLTPFLLVETNVAPGAELAADYGFMVWKKDTDYTLLVPLFPVGEGGAVQAFQGKVAYGPDATSFPDIHWQMRLVWLVQAQVDELVDCRNPEQPGLSTCRLNTQTKILHRYDDVIRLTGLQVSKSRDYEFAIFATPTMPQEDRELLKLQIGLNATFLNYERLEFQLEQETALQHVQRRLAVFDDLIYTWGVSRTLVTIEYQAHDHQDAGLVEMGRAANEILSDARYDYSSNRCPFMPGEEITCGTLLLAYEEDLGVGDLADASRDDARELRFSLAAIPLETLRGARLSMYERLGPDEWQIMELGRALALVEERYADRYESLIPPDYPYLDVGDMRFVTYAAYIGNSAGSVGAVAIDRVPLRPEIPDESALMEAVWGIGSGYWSPGKFDDPLPELVLGLFRPKPPTGFKMYGDVPLATLRKFARWHSFTGRVNKALGIGADVAGLVVSGINLYCQADPESGTCANEGALNAANEAVRWATVTANAAETIHAITEIYGVVKGIRVIEPLSKAAKIARGAGLVLGLGMTWASFALTFTGTQIESVRNMALAMAIATTVWLIALFVISLIPVFGQLLAAILSLIDAVIILVSGGEQSVAREIARVFYDVQQRTEPQGEPWISGWRSGVGADDPGLVEGSTFQIEATHHGVMKTTSWGYSSDLDDSWVKGETKPSPNSTVTGTDMSEGSDCVSKEEGVLWFSWGGERECSNTIRVGWRLISGLNIALAYEVLTRYQYVYTERILGWPERKVEQLTASWGTTDLPPLDVLPAGLDGLWNWAVLNNPDRDGDGRPNDTDVSPSDWDADDDHLSDGFEWGNGTIANDPDSDDDGLSDGQELRLGTQIHAKDSDGDGLEDGAEVFHQDLVDFDHDGDKTEWLGGWEVDLPGGAKMVVVSDPLEPDADGDGLEDWEEKHNRLSPYAANSAPTLQLNIAPFDIGSSRKMGVYVPPGETLTIRALLFNGSTETVSSDLTVCLPGFIGPAAIAFEGDRQPEPEVGTCDGSGSGYVWSFHRPALQLQSMETFSATLTAVVGQASVATSGVVSATLPWADMTLAGRLTVVVDGDAPSVAFDAPLDGALISGRNLIVGGVASDPTSWVTEVDFGVAPSGGATPVYTPTTGINPWAYRWTLPDDGEYLLQARARDQAGNEGFSAPVWVTVDNTSPVVSLAVGDYVSSSTDVVHLHGAATDNLSGLTRVQISIDQQPWRSVPLTLTTATNATWGYDWTVGASAQGSHSIRVRAIDRAGHISALETKTVTVDRVPPSDELSDRTYLHAPPAVAVSQLYTLTGVADEGGYLPRPSHPSLQDLEASQQSGSASHEFGVFDDANIWLGLSTIYDNDGGTPAAWLGDFNNDRMADLVVGLPAAADGRGQVIVLYGRAGDWAVPSDLEMLADSGAILTGVPAAGLGALVAAAGDVDGDGSADLLVGEADSERAFLVRGRPYPLGWQVLDAPQRSSIVALQAPDTITALAPAGDVNGDGFDDLLITGAGGAYLLLGRSQFWPETVDVAQEAAASWAGAVGATGLGNVDGDPLGLPELVVVFSDTVELYSWGYVETPAATLALNGATPQVVPLGDVDGDEKTDFVVSDGVAHNLVLGKEKLGDLQFDATRSDYQSFVAAPGDVDGDDINDILLGDGDGRACLIQGGPDISDRFSSGACLATIEGVAGAASTPYAAGADVNSDGSSDLLLIPSDGFAGGDHQTRVQSYTTHTRADEYKAYLPVVLKNSKGITSVAPGDETGPAALAAAMRRRLDYGEAAFVSPEALPRAAGVASGVVVPQEANPGRALATSAALAAGADTFYVDDDYCADCPNDGHAWGVDAFASIKAAVNAADDAGDSIVVGPGVYSPFEIGEGKDHLIVRGVDADAVFVDGGDGDYAVHVTDAVGVHLSYLTLRNAKRGVWLEKAGRLGHETPANRIELDHLLAHSCDHALDMDRKSTAIVRHSTLVAGGDTVVAVDEVKGNRWETRDQVPEPLGDGGALIQAGGALYALPGGGSDALYKMQAECATIRFEKISVHAQYDDDDCGGVPEWTCEQYYNKYTGLQGPDADGEFGIWLGDYHGGWVWKGDGLLAGDDRAIGVERQFCGESEFEVSEIDLVFGDVLGTMVIADTTTGRWSQRLAQGRNDVTLTWSVSRWARESSVRPGITAGDPAGTLWLLSSDGSFSSYDGGWRPRFPPSVPALEGARMTSAGPGHLYFLQPDGRLFQYREAEAGYFAPSYPFANSNDRVAVAGSYAYVFGPDWATHEVDLLVVDVSEPNRPHLVGSYRMPRSQGPLVGHDVAVAGDPGTGSGRAYAYVVADDAGLWVLDVSDPSAPRYAGFYDTPGSTRGVAVAGDPVPGSGPIYAYVAADSAGLVVVDVSNSTNPTMVGFYDTPGQALDVAVAGDPATGSGPVYAYVADWTGLAVVDVSDPTSPTLVGYCDTPVYARDVAVAGDPAAGPGPVYAYVADYLHGLAVVDVSSPTNPVQIGFYDTPGEAYGVAVAGDPAAASGPVYAYVADGHYDLRVIDVSDPRAPIEVGFYQTPERPYHFAQGVAVAGDPAAGSGPVYAYVADNTGMAVLDVSYPDIGWNERASLPGINGSFDLTWAGDALYALRGTQLYSYTTHTNNWTRLADVPAGTAIGSGVTMAPDSDTDPQDLYVMVGGGDQKMLRYHPATDTWDAGLLDPEQWFEGKKPFGVAHGDGLAYEDGYLYLYAVPVGQTTNFFRYGELIPLGTKLTFESTTFVNPSGAASWSNLDPASAPPEFGIELTGDNAWVSDDATWGPHPALGWGERLSLDAAAFVDRAHGAYRVGAGSTLEAGYYRYHPDAYVYPSRRACELCDAGKLVWGETAFGDLQAAVDSGATRVLVRPGVYPGSFYVVSGLEILGSGAELSVVEASEGSSRPLVRGEGVAAATVANLTLAGNGQTTGFDLEGGAQGVRLARNIVRDHVTGISVRGANTLLEVVNNTVVDNGDGMRVTDGTPLNVRNTIFAFNSGTGLDYTDAGAVSNTYNDFWANVDDLNPDDAGGGKIFLDPLFAAPLAHDYRLTDWSPAVDAGDPSDPAPPGTGGVVDMGYREHGRASYYADDGYGPNALNDGLTWGVDAFATIGDALNAAADDIAMLAAGAGAESLRLSVGVGPGTYAETLNVPSYVRLVGSGADVTTIDGQYNGSPVTFDGVVQAEVTGFTLAGSGTGAAGAAVLGATNGISVTRNIITGNADGVRFAERSSGSIAFNTIAENDGAGLLCQDRHTWVVAENNVVVSNTYGISSTHHGLLHNDYNLVANNTFDFGLPVTGTHTIAEDPAFGVGYNLSAGSPAVDAASPYAPVPAGGGTRADIGYKELLASPLTLLFGPEIRSTVTGNSGVVGVEVGVRRVTDPSAPLTGTLPTAWDTIIPSDTGQPIFRWTYAVAPDEEGLYRVYSRAQDAVGNWESDETVWYAGAFVGDNTAPNVSWEWPITDVTLDAAAVELMAMASDYVDDGHGPRFNVDQAYFRVDDRVYPAEWADEARWDPRDKGPRTFRAWVPLGVGEHTVQAVAVDGAGHRNETTARNITVGPTADVATVTSHKEGQAVDKPKLELAGYVRFATVGGARQVMVQTDFGPAVAATLADPAASISAWWANVTLPTGDGDHSVTVLVNGHPSQMLTVLLDTQPPTLEVLAPQAGDYVTRTVTFEATAGDDESGLAAVQVSIDGGYTWRTAEQVAGSWQLSWDLTGWQDFVSHPAVVRALDRAGNERWVERPITIDNLPPTGMDPVTFNHEPGTYLTKGTQLDIAWAPAIDASGLVTVFLTVDELVSNTEPTLPVEGTGYSIPLDSSGKWYVHLAATDAARNKILRHYGPWPVRDHRDRLIELDGFLDLTHEEWVPPAELLDDDERPARVQKLFASWDDGAFYLGWHGAWWPLDGTLWAYLGTGAASSSPPVAPIAGVDMLPLGATYAVEIVDTNTGRLWVRRGASWRESNQPLEFAHSSNGDTEVRLPWTANSASLIAFALDRDGEPQSVFPTPNPLVGPWTYAYHWDSLGYPPTPNTSQPQAKSLALSISSPQEGQAHWGSGDELVYRIQVQNREASSLTAWQLQLRATEGLAYQNVDGVACDAGCPPGGDAWVLPLPDLVAGGSQVFTVTGRLTGTDVLSSLNAVTTTGVLVHATFVPSRGPVSYRHLVDGQPPSVEISVPPGNAVRPGWQTVFGTTDDDGGSGVAVVEAEINGSWQIVTGTLFWMAKVNVSSSDDAFVLRVRATDGTGNPSEIAHTFNVDTVPPVLTPTVPLTLTGDYAVLRGTAYDPAPPDGSQVARVEVQLDEEDRLWLPVSGPTKSDESVKQSWLFIWDLPREDNVTHRLRARAFDAAGNETVTGWLPTTVDNVSPAVTITQVLTEVLVLDYYVFSGVTQATPVLSGTASDNGAVRTVEVLVYSPDGRAYREAAHWDGVNWRYVPRFENTVIGRYTLRLEAADANGNTTIAGPFYLLVCDNPIGDLQAVNDSPTMLTYPTTFTAAAIGGSNITYTWDFGDGTPPWMSKVDAMGTGSVVSHTYPAIGAYTATVSAANSVGRMSVTVPAIIVDVPVAYPLLDEGFEGSFPPKGWAVYQLADDQGGWQHSSVAAHDGSYSAFHDSRAAEQNSWLVTPQVIPSLGSRLAFWQNTQHAAVYSEHSIWVSTGSSDPTDGEYEELIELDPTTENTWEPVDVPLRTFASRPIYLAFRYEGDNADEWYLDDVVVTADLVAINDSPTLLGQSTTLTADVGSGTNIVYTWDLGDGTKASGMIVRHTYPAAGSYTAVVTASNSSNAMTASTVVQVLTLKHGFVMGAGWFDSPEGAYAPNPSLKGKGVFGFVVRYREGEIVPTGRLTFRLIRLDCAERYRQGGIVPTRQPECRPPGVKLNFKAERFDWLGVAGPKAQFQGTGTINGGGNYGFLVTVIDADLTSSADTDLFRIVIWDQDNTNTVIYDNQLGDDSAADPTTEIGGGRIVIRE